MCLKQGGMDSGACAEGLEPSVLTEPTARGQRDRETREKTKRTSSEIKIKVFLDAVGRKGTSEGIQN